METAMNESNNGKVGYKNPPEATRWKPGQSGNASCRPKKRKTLQDAVLDELNNLTWIREGEAEVEVSNNQAVAKALVRESKAGNMRAIAFLLGCSPRSSDVEQQDEASPEDLEILNDHLARQAKCSESQGTATDKDPQSDTHNTGDENGNEK
jgi:hypothetical protein